MNVSRKVALIALFTSISVSTDYLLVEVPNVKLMDGIVFMSSNLFGLEVGVTVGALTWLVYGTINPYGSATPGLLLVLMGGESLYTLAGWAVRRFGYVPSATTGFSVLLGFLGFICAAIYDLATNVYTGIFFYAGPLFNRVMYAIIMGIPFSLIHEVSDFVVFMFVLPPLMAGFSKLGLEVQIKHVSAS